VTLVIETIGLTKTFGSHRGIVGLDLSVAPGEIFAFLGPNGAGKSTTIRILLDLQRPTSGTANVLGLDAHRDSVAIHRRVGYIPGDLALYPRLTGWDHVEWFGKIRGISGENKARALAERFDLDLKRTIKELSKGNRQKVGIVLALAHDPELLILDEPTSGLDPLVDNEFENLLREIVAEGRTVFLSTHQLDEVQRIADRVAIIKDGLLVLTDTVDGLRRSAPQTVSIRFRAPVDPTLFAIDGVRVVSSHGSQLTLALTGPIGPLLRIAADLDCTDLVAHHADVDELFLSVYRDHDLEAVHANAD
jgi:ABC-2 type transport system ATP-binding protein